MRTQRNWIVIAMAVLVLQGVCWASTVITNTRSEIAVMAGFWESDGIQMSPLANAQFPTIGGGSNDWQYIYPHNTNAADGDVHIDMAINSSGTGTNGNNTGSSPIVAEIVNATLANLSQVKGLPKVRIRARGIFRYYTEHASERHFEVHPMTGIDAWNGSEFVQITDYHTNIAFVVDGTTHANSTLQAVFTQSLTATVMADNTNIIFTYTSPNVNYVQYGGVAKSGVLNDSVSSYFLFTPTSPAVSTTVRCRLVTNTAAAFNATGLSSNQAVTVNALTRWDLLGISNRVASLTANQTSIFSAPVELITLSVSSTGIVSSVANFTGSPTNGTEPMAVTFSDTSTGNLTNRFWDFGDTTTTNVTTNSVSHTYAAGSYGVTLIVNGSSGASTNAKPNYINVLTAFQAWQVQNFGSTNNPSADPSADPDGDGFTNLQEFQSGTSPTNNASFLGIIAIAVEADDVRVTWMTADGKTNALESTAGNAGDFSNNFSTIFIVTNAVGTTTNYLDLGAATNLPAFFYRVRLVP